jgi:molybdenum cofactor biosynthesis enzyme MoaA
MQYRVEDNPFESLGADLTHRCNMQCNFCYSPVRTPADMELSYFEEVCRRLPEPVTFKCLGGEPTLHPDLPGFIRAAARYDHEVVVLSNGRCYAEVDFVKELAQLDAPYSLGLSVDGGHSRADAYRRINGEDCLGWKMQALETLHRHWSGRLCLSAIIVRGVNEGVIPELLELAEWHRGIVRYIHFRTAGRAGRWLDTEPYSLEELKELVRIHFTEQQWQPRCVWELHCPPGEGCGGCYRFRPNRRLQISLIEFGTRRACTCPKRGKLVDSKFLVQSLFESIMRSGERTLGPRRREGGS